MLTLGFMQDNLELIITVLALEIQGWTLPCPQELIILWVKSIQRHHSRRRGVGAVTEAVQMYRLPESCLKGSFGVERAGEKKRIGIGRQDTVWRVENHWHSVFVTEA